MTEDKEYLEAIADYRNVEEDITNADMMCAHILADQQLTDVIVVHFDPKAGISEARKNLMIDPVSLAISTLSLSVSGLVWLTLFRRGTVKMTQPTVIFFGPDTPRSHSDTPLPKVYLRTLLFSTSKRGRVIESMHVVLSRNETHQNFNIWVMESEVNLSGAGAICCGNGHRSRSPLSRLLTTMKMRFGLPQAITGWMCLHTYSAMQNPYGFFLRH